MIKYHKTYLLYRYIIFVWKYCLFIIILFLRKWLTINCNSIVTFVKKNAKQFRCRIIKFTSCNFFRKRSANRCCVTAIKGTDIVRFCILHSFFCVVYVRRLQYRIISAEATRECCVVQLVISSRCLSTTRNSIRTGNAKRFMHFDKHLRSCTGDV